MLLLPNIHGITFSGYDGLILDNFPAPIVIRPQCGNCGRHTVVNGDIAGSINFAAHTMRRSDLIGKYNIIIYHKIRVGSKIYSLFVLVLGVFHGNSDFYNGKFASVPQPQLYICVQ